MICLLGLGGAAFGQRGAYETRPGPSAPAGGWFSSGGSAAPSQRTGGDRGGHRGGRTVGPPIVYPYRVWGLPLYPAPSPFPYGMPGYAATYSMQTVQEGFLQLHTEPVDAAVTIDGMRIGGLWEQGQQFPVRAGMHTVEASREGFRTRVEKVQVGPGQIAPVWLTLIRGPEPTPLGESEDRGELVRPSRVPSAEAVAASSPAEPAEEGTGSLKLSVRKSRGQVFIDGQPKGDVGSDGKLLTLPVGDHAVRVDYPTGRPSLLNVRIRKNQTSEIVVP